MVGDGYQELHLRGSCGNTCLTGGSRQGVSSWVLVRGREGLEVGDWRLEIKNMDGEVSGGAVGGWDGCCRRPGYRRW